MDQHLINKSSAIEVNSDKCIHASIMLHIVNQTGSFSSCKIVFEMFMLSGLPCIFNKKNIKTKKTGQTNPL